MSSRLVARPNVVPASVVEKAGTATRPKDKNTAMPELLIDFITSLDGYAAADGWPGWWGLEGPEYLAWLGEQPEADYTVLMGATTYRVMSEFAAGGEPGTEALAALSTVVFSTTLSEPLSWANALLVAQDPVEAVREMKDKASKSMRTIGSLTLCRSLQGRSRGPLPRGCLSCYHRK
jgi:dihydrofolate reductase